MKENTLPQTTTIGRRYYNPDHVKTIERYLIENRYPSGRYEVIQRGRIIPYFIVGTPDESELPVLDIPYYIEVLGKKPYLVTDMRMFVNYDPYLTKMSDSVRQMAGFTFVRDISLWTMIFMDDPMADSGFMDYGMMMYILWITRSLSFGAVKLTPDEIVRTMVICGLFYKQIASNDPIDPRMVGFRVSRLFRLPEKEVMSVVENETIDHSAHTIEGLVTNLQTIVEEGKRKYFTMMTILDILSKTWYGYNKQTYLPIAIECRSVWVSILYHTITNSTYKNTILKSIVDRQATGKQKVFIRSYEDMINQLLAD